MNKNKTGYYITQDNPTLKIPLHSQEKIFLPSMGIIELVLPECKYVWCSGNELTKLIIPESCESINCQYNNLTELIIPRGCTYVSCGFNNLPKVIENLFNSDDPIKIQLANNLQLAKK